MKPIDPSGRLSVVPSAEPAGLLDLEDPPEAGNEVAIETIEIAHEGLTIQND